MGPGESTSTSINIKRREDAVNRACSSDSVCNAEHLQLRSVV
jgi:hypothetical protein